MNNQPSFVTRTLQEILTDLYKPIPKRLIQKRKQGGKEIEYVNWYIAVRLLDHYAFGWRYKVLSIQEMSNKIMVVVEITICGTDGEITRCSSGQEDMDDEKMYGDAISNAEANALKRCAAKFGLGLHLYDDKNIIDWSKPIGISTSKTTEPIEPQEPLETKAEVVETPKQVKVEVAQTVKDTPTQDAPLANEKQIEALRKLVSNDKNSLQSEAEIVSNFTNNRSRNFERLTSREAGKLIVALNEQINSSKK